MTADRFVLRDATAADVPAIRDLYNATIDDTTTAWTDEPETAAERERWFRDRQAADDPVLVVVDGDEVLGFTAWGWFRGAGRWPGYRHTKELSIHVARTHQGQGVGRLLIEGLVEQARARGVHVLMAGVDSATEGSLRFHEAMGFTEVARMPEVGRKFDRWLDLVLLQRIVDP